jgi:integral membrane protein (TIGR01906 family)
MGRVQKTAVVAIALLIPLLMIANGIYVLAHPWFVRFEYQRHGFPADAFGMSTHERTRLARLGLPSILPWERKGISLLERARLSDGSPAFGPRELRHMRHVRSLLLALLSLHAVGIAALLALAARRRTRPLVRRGLRAGVGVTLGLGATVGIMLLVNPIGFLTAFHTLVFFSGSTWRFADSDTLRRLYPDRFWQDTAVLLSIGVAVQAALVLALTGGVRRQRTIHACRTGS